ncbi:hypothetical protein KP13_04534 [Klebsiella pneumoniae subsp. pneumoniae Kp13]|nr:hypothetical protein KP13_04534 [Klebsiella pneumoniae subsp. pneumoniae Kp13]
MFISLSSLILIGDCFYETTPPVCHAAGEHERIRLLYGGNCRRAFLAGVSGRDGK